MNAILNLSMKENSNKNMVSDTISKYSKQLFSFIKNKVNIIEDAEDILQEVWFQFSKLSNLDDLENVSSWLYTVSRNKITDFYRKNKTDNLEDYTYEDDQGDFQIKDILLMDTTNNPELAFFKKILWDELFKALEELPLEQKEVFILNEIEEKTLKEISEEKNENIKTIISRKGYAIKHLRKKLLPLYQELNY